MASAKTADAFLEIAGQFRLGELPTEQPHPLTRHLSILAVEDLPGAHACLREVDRLAWSRLAGAADGIARLAEAVGETLRDGGRLFLGGCGATGRLSLTIETLCREGMLGEPFRDRVVGFMAGGDTALIRSLEGFEDFPEFGARQLHELGFREGDLFVGITEGGETPFVIGATEAAAAAGGRRPWFCYCNPDAVLRQVAERSRRVLDADGIEKLNLHVGPMAITGSTRMQATSVQMIAVGLAIRHHGDPDAIAGRLATLLATLAELEYGAMAPLTEAEADANRSDGNVLYEPDGQGMTVLTDTTERSPTFSLPPFENANAPDDRPSPCYLCLPEFPDAPTAWRGLLQREPRTLDDWPEVAAVAGRPRLLGFDISVQARSRRAARTGVPPETFRIRNEPDGLRLAFRGGEAFFALPPDALTRELALKVVLNAHSTLIMGRLGRYEGNLMTWVQASNNKLIDRSIRYVRQLAEQRSGTAPTYEATCRVLFDVRRDLPGGRPIVLETLERLGIPRR